VGVTSKKENVEWIVVTGSECKSSPFVRYSLHFCPEKECVYFFRKLSKKFEAQQSQKKPKYIKCNYTQQIIL
jgi:hypothetical protein